MTNTNAKSKRKRKAQDARALQASIYQRERDILDRVKQIQEEKGYRVSDSAIIRALINELGAEGIDKLIPPRY